MFTAALFTTAKTWKQPQGPSTEERIYKMWYLYTMEYYLAIKNEIYIDFFSLSLSFQTGDGRGGKDFPLPFYILLAGLVIKLT